MRGGCSLDYTEVVRRVDELRAKTVTDPSGCIEWVGNFSAQGYGRIYHKRKQYVAHRVFYIAARGTVPDGFSLDHLCRNKSCVNPDHLEPVTWEENARRAVSSRPLKTHCKYGHSLADAYMEKVRGRKPIRRCRPCSRRRHAAYDGTVRRELEA